MGIEAAIAAALTTYIGATAAAVAASVITGLARAIVFAGISRALTKKPGGPKDISGGTPVSTRQPAAPWQVVYGTARVGGTYAFLHTGAADNAFLHIVIVIADHEVDAIQKVYFDSEELVFDGSGNCTGAIKPDGVQWVHYAGHVFMVKRLGAAGQTAIPELVSALPAFWTSQHRGEGHAYVYLRLKYAQGVFPNGVPGITFQIRGRNRIFDPRTGTTGYTSNAALCLADYLTNATFGLGVDYATEIDETELIAAANICAETVPLAAGGVQVRYDCNGAFTTDRTPREIIGDLLTAMGGSAAKAHPIGGKWKIFPGAYRTPTLTLDESDLRGPITVQPRLSRRDAFNGVKGLYLAENNRFQPADFPAVQVAAYVTEDNGEEIWKDIQLPFTNNGPAAQRIARLELERARRQVTVVLPCKFSAWRLQAGDTFMLDNTRFGWSAKVFEVVETRLAAEADGTIGVDLSVREIDSGAYSWSASEQATNAAPVTNLPDPFTVAAPGLALSEDLVVTASGGVLARLILDVTAPNDAMIVGYEAQVRVAGPVLEWTQLGAGPGVQFILAGVEDGVTYEARVRAKNGLGVPSDWTTKQLTIIGQTARPADVTGFAANIIGADCHLSWDPVADVDLSHYRVRFSTATSGATWGGAVDLVVKVARPATSVTVPALVGTFLIKATDLKGNESAGATAVVAAIGEVLGLNAVETVTEHSAFAGAKMGVAALGGGLQLVGSDTLASWTTLSSIAVVGLGTAGLLSEGTYAFAGSVDLSAVYTSRLTAAVIVTTKDFGNLLRHWSDLRLIDTLGGGNVGAHSVELQIRFTSDDPAGAPAWSAWRAFAVGDYTARAFQFRAILRTSLETVSPLVTGLSVTVDMPDRVLAGADLATDAAGSAIAFTPAFKALKGLSIVAQNLQQGDYWTVTAKSATGYTIRFFNTAGGGVSRTLDWTAVGYGSIAA